MTISHSETTETEIDPITAGDGRRVNSKAIRLLVVNPNTSVAATERISQTAMRAAAIGTTIEAVSARSGIPLIETLEQSRLAGHAVVRLLVMRARDFDAAIIAAFSDPGLSEARNCIAQPVIGIAEASILEAAAKGRRFAVLMPGGPLMDHVRRFANSTGVGTQLVAVRDVDVPFSTVAAEPSRYLAQFRDALCRAITVDRAEVIVVGGGPLAGIAERLAPEFNVPLIDGVISAVQRAERLVRSNAELSAADGVSGHAS